MTRILISDWFRLVTRALSPGGILTVDLVTSDNIIDREHAEILSEGGLYQFQVILASDWSRRDT